ncbi:EamA family transporter RarD [Streptococcus saliviloxodontae]|uniref:Chloramphenicol-sensitive protein RarD n=1 Tax=Streptococcus saliviloxodontae TaxID=1349416 RepID=A0ABS2PLS6_9STRE|nr:EamA family transporter RarD [Streptococcus saliviloxodontae]MBM7636326.1 chloramphenicol-sensitive protein RarD [Streptococcus saliviloxodontae]
MSTKQKGLLLALGTYLMWGFLSLFWKQLSHVNAYNTFSYRIIWTLVTMLVYMVLAKKKDKYQSEIADLISSRKNLAMMLLASVLIATNWLVYIYAVGNGQATEASLGYYILPLFSVVLSLVFLKEKLSMWTWISVFIAVTGVGLLVANTGSLPVISLILTISFGLYGFVKKGVKLSSDVAMLVEAVVIAPFALVYLIFFSKESFLDYSLYENFLLIISGAVTAIPLLLFAEAVKRAPLNQVGFIQYINPTIQLLIAIFIFGETITIGELKGFVCIWLAIGIFILGQVVELRQRK